MREREGATFLKGGPLAHSMLYTPCPPHTFSCFHRPALTLSPYIAARTTKSMDTPTITPYIPILKTWTRSSDIAMRKTQSPMKAVTVT